MNSGFSSTSAWAVPTEVVTGVGSINRAARNLAMRARSVLVVYDQDSASATTVEQIRSQMDPKRNAFASQRLESEPGRLSDAITVADISLAMDVDHLIAVGGPNVIDVVKVGGLIARNYNRVDMSGNVEFDRADKSPLQTSIPVVTVPTTIGTATEVSGTALLVDCEGNHLLRHPFLQPSYAVLDPLATASLSLQQVLTGAIEALGQVLIPTLSQPCESPLADELTVAVARCIIDHADRAASDRTPPIVRTLDTHRIAVANTTAITSLGLLKPRADRGNRLWCLALPAADALGLPVSNLISMLFGAWFGSGDSRLGPWPGRLSQILGMLGGGSAVMDPVEWISRILTNWGLPDRLTSGSKALPSIDYLTRKVYTSDFGGDALTHSRDDIAKFFSRALAWQPKI